VAAELGCSVALSREEALAADLLVTVTPGHEVVLADGALQPGQHVSLMGADGPGKAEVAGTELAHAVDEGLVAETDVTAIGAVLAGTAPGRADDQEITMFDSTGLAIQDLAIALAALDGADRAGLPRLTL
jgi:ornithine cyclodeaminase/alanine dehydrogenase-like protein (mu-crystallin family)